MRKPMAVSNWKMEMTIARSLAFVRDFQLAIGDLAQAVDIVLCPPYTALYSVAQVLKDSPIQLGYRHIDCLKWNCCHSQEAAWIFFYSLGNTIILSSTI